MNRSHNLRNLSRGFTLLEVMVALLIIALSLTGIAVTMGSMLNNATTLRERTFASWIAQNKIIEVRAAGSIPALGETSGFVDYANTEWEWRANVAETGVEDLLRIDVAILRPNTETTIRSVTGFIGEPVTPGQANRTWISGAIGNPRGDNENSEEATR